MSIKDECDLAIAAHGSWKLKFKRLVAGEVQLDAATTRRCDVCDFGKWLGGSGRAGLGSDFVSIDGAHKHFHQVAADVVELHNAGKKDAVTAALAATGEFTRAGVALTGLLVAVRAKAA